MTEWAPKRFWTETRADACEGGYTVYLDSRTVKTPAKTAFVVPTPELAEACAAEWHAQEEHINPADMPMTRMVNSALDKVATQHAEVATLLAAYGDSDLVCYRADYPETLVARQAEHWDPLLEWAEETFGARLIPRTGIMYEAQNAEAVARLEAVVHALDAFRLAAFHDLVSLSGSLVIALAVTQGHLDPEQAWNLSRLDEEWQIEQWGDDEEASEHAARKKQAFLHAAHFFRLADQ